MAAAYSPYAPAIKSLDVELVTAPINACTIFPQGKAGSVTVNGTRYALGYISHAPGDVDGYRLTAGAKVYDLDADLTSCDCPDGTFRVRPGGCKHARALRELRDAGRIA